MLAPYGDALALGLVVATITYLSLIFGELVPKRIGLANAEGVATLMARPMRLLSSVASPLVGLLSVSTEAVLGLLRLRTTPDATVTEDEVKMMIAEGAEAGVFFEAEREIVESVFQFADRRAGELMVPRPRIVWLDSEDSPEVNRQRLANGSHGFYPVARGDLDEMLGIVSVKRLTAELLAGQSPDLMESLIPPTFVPETMTALQLLERLRAASPRVAIVVDEHGSVVGLVTPADILEAIVGDLPETGPGAGPEMVRRDDGSWLVDGLLSVEDLDEQVGLGPLTDEDRRQFRTVGGLVMHHLGRIPQPGDRLVWRSLQMEVVDMDGRRVDKVLVAPVPGQLPENST
jgi:putative hemolysin